MGGEEEDKVQTPKEELPDYKSLNCNQKGDRLSATALLLFHYSLRQRQQVPLQKHDSRTMENVQSTSGFQLGFHEA